MAERAITAGGPTAPARPGADALEGGAAAGVGGVGSTGRAEALGAGKVSRRVGAERLLAREPLT